MIALPIPLLLLVLLKLPSNNTISFRGSDSRLFKAEIAKTAKEAQFVNRKVRFSLDSSMTLTEADVVGEKLSYPTPSEYRCLQSCSLELMISWPLDLLFGRKFPFHLLVRRSCRIQL